MNFCNTFAGLCQKATLVSWLNSTVSFVDMFALFVGTKVGSWVKFFAKPLLRRMSSSPSVFEVKWGAAVACSNCHLGASKLCTLLYSLFAQKIQVSENRVSHSTKEAEIRIFKFYLFISLCLKWYLLLRHTGGDFYLCSDSIRCLRIGIFLPACVLLCRSKYMNDSHRILT